MALIIFDALPFLHCTAGLVTEAGPSTLDVPARLLDVTLGSSGLRVFLHLLSHYLMRRLLQMLRSVMMILVLMNLHFFLIRLKCTLSRFPLLFFCRSRQNNQCTLQGWATIFNVLMRWGCRSQRDVDLAVNYVWILRLRGTLNLNMRWAFWISQDHQLFRVILGFQVALIVAQLPPFGDNLVVAELHWDATRWGG
jgi:hypothetical protein